MWPPPCCRKEHFGFEASVCCESFQITSSKWPLALREDRASCPCELAQEGLRKVGPNDIRHWVSTQPLYEIHKVISVELDQSSGKQEEKHKQICVMLKFRISKSKLILLLTGYRPPFPFFPVSEPFYTK